MDMEKNKKMNLDIFKQEDPSGKFSNEKWLSNNHPIEYNTIIDYCKNKNLNIPFKEKVYCFLNNLDVTPCCKNKKCNKKVKYKNKNIGYSNYCSNKCISTCEDVIKKKKNTNLEKLGVEFPMKSNKVLEKSKKTNLERYGTEYPMQNENVKKRSEETCLDIYNKKTYSQTDLCKDQVKNTNMERYGVDNVLKLKSKICGGMLDKYGVEYPIQNDLIKDKIEKTNLERYGVDNVSKNDDIKRKKENTFIKKYGVDNPIKSEEIKNKIKIHNNDKFYLNLRNEFFNLDFISIDRNKYKSTLYCDMCQKQYTINVNLLRYRCKMVQYVMILKRIQ